MIVEKHSRLPRKFSPGEPPQRITVRGKAVPDDVRASILNDAKEQILGGMSIAQIAEKHGIAERTLEYWLAAMGEEYEELRRVWIDNMLTEARELMKNPGEDDKAPLRLAKARDLWKSATWYAERRDRQRYGQDQTQAVVVTPVLHITVNSTELPAIGIAPRAHPREPGPVIDVEVSPAAQQSGKSLTDQ